MGTHWKQHNLSLQSQDENVVLQALLDLKRYDAQLDDDAIQAVVPRCLEKLGHHDIEIRSAALGVITNQVKLGNSSIVGLLDPLIKKIQSPNLLDLEAGKDKHDAYVSLHRDACYIIGMLQNSFPRKLMSGFKTLSKYVINCTDHTDRDIATAGVEFWGKMNMPPVPDGQMTQWAGPVHTKLNKLVPALLNAMVYQEEHVSLLEKQGKAGGKSEEEIEQITNMRNYAALAFEQLCAIFPQEIIVIFKPQVEKRVMGNNWLETEAVLLALSAFTASVGTPKELNDLYPKLLHKLLDLYSHPKPLIRSIVCFTMQHFLNIRAKGVKDFFSKMMKSTIACIADSDPEVQIMALRCMTAILAYSDHDCSAYSEKLVSAFSNFKPIDNDAKMVYFECAGHFFGRMGTVLDPEDMRNTIAPLMDYLRSTEKDNALTIVACQALCTAAMYSGSNFSPYNERIFDKACQYLDLILSGVPEARGETGDKHGMAYMDLISAILEGQGHTLTRTVTKFELVPKLVSLVKKKKTHPNVVQSALALLGNIGNHCFDCVEPQLDAVVEIITGKITSKQTIAEVRINALWCLMFISEKASKPHDGMLKLTDDLVKIVKGQQHDFNSVAYAAIALTNQAMLYPKILNAAVVNDEVFMSLCQLLQSEFPRDQERDRLFKNMVCISQENIKKLKVACWAAYCRAAAVVTSQDDALNTMLRSNLRDIRGSMGQNGWKKLTLQIGPQLGFALRKKYKLY